MDNAQPDQSQGQAQNLSGSSSEKKLANSTSKLHLMLGGMGLAMPPILYFGTLYATGDYHVRSSISAYFYSPVGNLFVGIVFAMGTFLLTFEGYAEAKFKLMSFLAGVAGITFALFPTTPEGHNGLVWYGRIHIYAVFIFYLILSILSIWAFKENNSYNGTTDPDKKQRKLKAQSIRNALYMIFGILMLICILIIFLKSVTSLDLSFFPTYWLEYLANIFFGLSWLIKGEGVFFLNGDQIWDKLERLGQAIFILLLISNLAFLVVVSLNM